MALVKDPLIHLAPSDDVRLDVSLMASAGMTGVTLLKVRGARREDSIAVWLNREYVEISTEFRWRHPEPTIDKPQRLGKMAQAVVTKGEGEIEDMQFRWSLIPLRKFCTMCFGVAEIRVRLGQGNPRRRAAAADRRRGRVR